MDALKNQFTAAGTIQKETPQSSYDQVWDAIPLFELLDYAVEHSDKCSPRSENEIRECAKSIVQNNICFCCRSEETIIETITDEFIRQMKTAHKSPCNDNLELFSQEKKHGNCTCNSRRDNETTLIGIRTRQSQNDRPGKNK